VTIRAEYDRAAANYDRRWARYNRASLELLPLGRVEHDLGRVLDVGCGTGNLLPFLEARGYRMQEYVGVDLSPEMLRIARTKPGRVPASWITADAARLPLRESSFDIAVSASVLHYWDDVDAALAEIRRVLRPGGHLLLLDWVRDPQPMRLLNAWMRITRVRYQRMYSRAELQAALARAGFNVRSVVQGSAGGLWRLVAFEARVV
jgi:ubiquinone/menaquinone biosynthesis C-methylase UbiE